MCNTVLLSVRTVFAPSIARTYSSCITEILCVLSWSARPRCSLPQSLDTIILSFASMSLTIFDTAPKWTTQYLSFCDWLLFSRLGCFSYPRWALLSGRTLCSSSSELLRAHEKCYQLLFHVWYSFSPSPYGVRYLKREDCFGHYFSFSNAFHIDWESVLLCFSFFLPSFRQEMLTQVSTIS